MMKPIASLLLQADAGGLFSKYILPAFVLMITYFSPTVYWITAIGFFITADFILRALLILRTNPENFVSSKAWKTVYKFGVGMIFIVVAHVAQRIFAPDMPFMKIIGSFLILCELKSIDEKAKEATGYSLFSLIVDKLIPRKE